MKYHHRYNLSLNPRMDSHGKTTHHHNLLFPLQHEQTMALNKKRMGLLILEPLAHLLQMTYLQLQIKHLLLKEHLKFSWKSPQEITLIKNFYSERSIKDRKLFFYTRTDYI